MPPRSSIRRLSNLSAIITGAGRGIGRATAELFAREGAEVILCSRTRKELDATVKTIRAFGGTAIGCCMDVGRARQAEALVTLSLRRFGKLDVLINNAGVLGPRVSLADYPLAEWDEVIRVNLSGVFYMTHAAAQAMIGRRVGCIVNLTSTVGRQGRAGWGAYAVSKFGVEGLTQVLAQELHPFGVRVFALNPGATRTPMRADAYPQEDPTQLASPHTAADALLRVVVYASLAQSGTSFDLASVPHASEAR